MKYFSTLSLIIILFFSNVIKAQESENARLGEILKIGISDKYQYSDVKFPKPNFIIKKGGIANYSQLEGTIVEITELRTGNNNQTIVILRRKDGKKFFGSFPEIRANYDQALASGELTRI